VHLSSSEMGVIERERSEREVRILRRRSLLSLAMVFSIFLLCSERSSCIWARWDILFSVMYGNKRVESSEELAKRCSVAALLQGVFTKKKRGIREALDV
jgi:hypothetical protein